MLPFICSSYNHVTYTTIKLNGLLLLANVGGMETTVAHCVRCTLHLCGYLMRLVVKVIMQSDRDFMEVIHLH